jgi:hypothetical protein
MPNHARIILEKTSPTYWKAWFEDTPRITCGGTKPDQAFARLLVWFPDHGLNLNEASVVATKSSGNRIEVAVPFKTTIPQSSLN